MKKLMALMFCVMLGSAALLAGCSAPKQSSTENAAPQMEESTPAATNGGAMEEATPGTTDEGAGATEAATPGADGSQTNDEGTQAQ